jgi:hypothetical protein
MTSLRILTDIARYAVSALILAACGRSLCQILKIPLDEAAAWLLGPVIAEALWAAILAGAVWWGLPLKQIAEPLMIGTVLLTIPAGVEAYRLCRDSRRRVELNRAFVWLGISAALPIVVLLPYFVYGLSDYPGGRAPDGWAYTALGQYLWEFPRGTHGGLAPIFQWASHLSGARHTASASMAVLSLATRQGDTQTAAGLFCALAMFSYASACAALGCVRSLHRFRLLLFVVLATWSGWLWNVIAVNNFDNALVLAYLPAFACVASIRGIASRGEWALCGLLSSGVIHTYPEFAAVILLSGAALLGHRSWREGDRRWVSGVLIALGVSAVFSGLYWPADLQFIRVQVGQGLSNVAQPGEELFAGLIGARTALSGFWALGSEFTAQPLLGPRNAAGAILTILAAVGIWNLGRNRDWGVVAVLAALLTGALFFAVHQHYSYGAYKFVLLAWWALAVALMAGIERLAAQRTRWPALVRICPVVACLAIPTAATVRALRAVLVYPGPSMAIVREVQQVERFAGTQPIAIGVDDEWASQWATYYLRDTAAQLEVSSGYLSAPHVRWLMDEAPRVPVQSIHFVLTGARGPDGAFISRTDWRLIWRNSVFALWDPGRSGLDRGFRPS